MEDYQRAFIEFALEREALRFGEFTLKSGRVSPYFFNSGTFDSGATIRRLAGFYGSAIAASRIEFDALYGPAYKGIPLVTAIAMGLSERDGRDLPYCFNRKEAKDHGEGGVIVGARPMGRVLVVDDVISAGTSARESVSIIRDAGAEPVGMAISLDRQERGAGRLSAIQEIEQDLGLRVVNIINLDQLVHYLELRVDLEGDLERVRAYRARFGVEAAHPTQ